MQGISAREYQKRLAPLLKLSAVQELVYEELIKFEDVLIDLKIDEFKHGLLPNGRYIGYYRSERYRQSKLRQNPLAGGRVDLIRTGAFTNGLFLLRPSTQRSTGNLFGSRDKKRNDLVDKYGKDIMNLSPNTLSKLSKDLIAPRFTRTIKQRFRIG